MDALLKSGNSQNIDKPSEQKKQLVEKAKKLAAQSKSEATALAYRKDFERFCDWANDQDLDFLPAAPGTVALYITHLDSEHKAPATIMRVLASLSTAHQAFKLESPTSDPAVTEVLKGIKRTRGVAPKRQAKPLLAKQLIQIINVIPTDVVGKRDKALLLVGWAGAMRRSEISALKIEDIEKADQGLVVTIRRSKTDPYGKGQKVALPALQNACCPCEALKKWVDLAKIESGFLFCGVGFAGKNRFFETVDNSNPLDPRMVSLIVKKYVKAIGLEPAQYSAHSLRAGWTTSAAGINAPNKVMMRHTRHRSLSTLLGYIRGAELFDNNPLPLMLAT